jgi:hypothetical protein
MQNDWTFMRWWDSVEIETILRHVLNVEGLLIIGAALVFVLWNRWFAYADRRLRLGLDHDLDIITRYMRGENSPEALSTRYRRRSTVFLLQLIQRVDAIHPASEDQRLRLANVRRHILETAILGRARVLARSMLSSRRAMALTCFRHLPRAEDEQIIIDLMKDQIPVIKLGAARLALRIGSESAVASVIEFLGDEKRYVRNLIHLSAQDTSPAFVEKIRHRLNSTRDIFEHKLCLDLISARLDDRQDGEMVFGFTRSENKELKISALRALCRSRCARAYVALSHAITDPDWEVRAVTCRLIGEYGFTDAISHLTKCCHDPNWWVRKNASFSLLQFGAKGEVALKQLTNGDDRFAREIASLALKSLAVGHTAVPA